MQTPFDLKRDLDEILKFFERRAIRDGLTCCRNAVRDGGGGTADVDGGTRVQEADIRACVRDLAAEDAARDGSVLVGLAAANRFLGCEADAEVLGADLVRALRTVRDFVNLRRCADGDLIHAVRSVNDECTLYAEIRQYLCERAQ